MNKYKYSRKKWALKYCEYLDPGIPFTEMMARDLSATTTPKEKDDVFKNKINQIINLLNSL